LSIACAHAVALLPVNGCRDTRARLDGAVLSRAAVQPHEHDVDLEGVGVEQQFDESLRARECTSMSMTERSAPILDSPKMASSYLGGSNVRSRRIATSTAVSGFAQCLGDTARARERYIALGRVGRRRAA
jgi:hypothetical protein